MLPHFWNKSFTLLASLLLTSAIPITAQAKPTQLTKPTPIVKQPQLTTYEQAQKDLPARMYVLYRIADRLSRANNLDQTSWQLAIASKYDPNAFASDPTFVPIAANLLDQLDGDSSAIACIMGREMAHHALHHQTLTSEQAAAILAQPQLPPKKKKHSSSFLQTIGTIGAIFGKPNSTTSNNSNTDDKIAAQQRDELQQLAGLQARQEIEADNQSYLYAVRAGFEPEGCTRALNLIQQQPNQILVSARAETFQSFVAQNPAPPLAAEGKKLISQSKPLTYTVGEKSVLRLNSRNGSSMADINRLFGK